MHFLAEYGFFLAKTATLVLAVIAILLTLASLSSKAKDKARGELVVNDLNDQSHDTHCQLNRTLLDKTEQKALKKTEKATKKSAEKSGSKPKLFVLHFEGDLRATHVNALTEEVNAILLVAKKRDKVLVCIESPGGVVHGYGLAASQIHRIKNAGLNLTVAVDKVAASGGYLMACVADHIISAPFAIVGSIGVIAQLPNFNKLLKKSHIDFEQIMAGQYKRTLSFFGENTDEGRAKMQHDINDTHDLFKHFVHDNRPSLDIDSVATGEHWYGTQALTKGLVDAIQTSDDFIQSHLKDYHAISIEYKIKAPLMARISQGVDATIARLTNAHAC